LYYDSSATPTQPFHCRLESSKDKRKSLGHHYDSLLLNQSYHPPFPIFRSPRASFEQIFLQSNHSSKTGTKVNTAKTMTIYAPGTPQEAIDADQALQLGTWHNDLIYPLS
jgi:hypothetical protein